MESDDVIRQLKAVSQAGEPVKLVVSRCMDSPEPGVLPEINDVCMEREGGREGGRGGREGGKGEGGKGEGGREGERDGRRERERGGGEREGESPCFSKGSKFMHSKFQKRYFFVYSPQMKNWKSLKWSCVRVLVED